jgi:transmembrane sensor
MTETRLAALIVRRISGQLTELEAEELNMWVDQAPANKDFLDRITDEEQLERELNLWKNIDPAEGYAKWELHIQTHRRRRIRRIVGWSVAASLLTGVTVIGLSKKEVRINQPAPVVAEISQPVLPGRNTAMLTLSNGQQIQLDSAGNGDLVMQGNARLIKTDGKSILYTISGKDTRDEALYNTLTTPRSGQYQLILPDGTHVWLNNVSTLRYPTTFQGKDRTVELIGEAYFEIAKDAARPFYVKVKDETVEVLGTSFNVMAYPDEEGGTKTTLLSGAVRVKAENAAVQLRPDEQARFNIKGGLSVIKYVPSADIVSWKNGFFYFGRASLKEVMHQLARWYDVEVSYQGNIPDVEFGGKIDRSLPLNDLLNFLDKNQVQFRLEGRKIIVLP